MYVCTDAHECIHMHVHHLWHIHTEALTSVNFNFQQTFRIRSEKYTHTVNFNSLLIVHKCHLYA